MSQKAQDILYLTEIFASIQGETSFTGLPTTFVRLSNCNLRCQWCDTPYSFKRGQPWNLDQILEKVDFYGCSFVCITGGEPLLQLPIYSLMQSLCHRGFHLSLETGGSLSIDRIDPRVAIILDIKCPGSGMSKKNEWNNLSILKPKDEVKFVILDEQDYEYAKEVCTRYGLYTRVKDILFSPVHGKLDPQTLISWILKDRLPVRLNVQLHKYIWNPSTRGV